MQTLLFVDGESFEVSNAFAKLICSDEIIEFQKLEKIMNDNEKSILLYLINNGSLAC